MPTLKKQLKQNLTVIFFGVLFAANNLVMAETDLAAQESYLRMRVKSHQQATDHAAHIAPIDKSLDFHGVFYGFFPCDDCLGIKMTLSLKQNHNYLLVSQSAKGLSREFYEKGKYSWDDDQHIVVLTPRKEAPTRQYRIDNEDTLVQLDSDGQPMADERYALRRSDTVKSREIHFH
jgi:hypothetical protein